MNLAVFQFLFFSLLIFLPFISVCWVSSEMDTFFRFFFVRNDAILGHKRDEEEEGGQTDVLLLLPLLLPLLYQPTIHTKPLAKDHDEKNRETRAKGTHRVIG